MMKPTVVFTFPNAIVRHCDGFSLTLYTCIFSTCVAASIVLAYVHCTMLGGKGGAVMVVQTYNGLRSYDARIISKYIKRTEWKHIIHTDICVALPLHIYIRVYRVRTLFSLLCVLCQTKNDGKISFLGCLPIFPTRSFYVRACIIIIM